MPQAGESNEEDAMFDMLSANRRDREPGLYCGYCAADCQCDKLFAPAEEERVGGNEKRTGALLREAVSGQGARSGTNFIMSSEPASWMA
jgi:hypothetical protein